MWEETVMKQSEMADVLDKNTPLYWACTALEATKLCEAQAQITGDIAYKKGYEDAEKKLEDERDKFNYWFNKKDEEIIEASKVGARKVVERLQQVDKHARFGFEDGTLLVYKEDLQVILKGVEK